MLRASSCTWTACHKRRKLSDAVGALQVVATSSLSATARLFAVSVFRCSSACLARAAASSLRFFVGVTKLLSVVLRSFKACFSRAAMAAAFDFLKAPDRVLCQHTSAQGPVFFGKNSINLYSLGPQLTIADCVHHLLVKADSAAIGAVGGTAATASVLMCLFCAARPSLFHSMPYAPTAVLAHEVRRFGEDVLFLEEGAHVHVEELLHDLLALALRGESHRT